MNQPSALPHPLTRTADQVPLSTDTEAETSIDMDLTFGDISRKAENITAKRRSLFNLTLTNIQPTEEARQSVDFKSFETFGKQEIDEWSELFTKLKNELRQAKNGHPAIDVTILPEEKHRFLQAEPGVDVYLRNLHERHCFLLEFLDDLENMLKLQQKISEICEFKVQFAKQQKLNEFICNENIF